MVTNYSELVADQSQTKCKTIAEHAVTGPRLVGNLLATITVVVAGIASKINGCRGSKQNQPLRGLAGVASSVGLGLKIRLIRVLHSIVCYSVPFYTPHYTPSTVQSLYNAMFEVHRNGPYYK